MGIQYSSVPFSLAPQIEMLKEGDVKANIRIPSGSYTLTAERDIRAWQTLLIAYALIDIDFDNATEEFKAEAGEEKIVLPNFSRSTFELTQRGFDFSVFGRAFLSIEKGVPLIEWMSLYRDGAKALFAERSIDAYNQFYLFIETQFCNGKTKTRLAVQELTKNSEFMSALDKVASQAQKSRRKLDKLSFAALSKWPSDRHELVEEIVELRGRLRHHSLNSPNRWDPNKQGLFDQEARFLALIAHELAYPRTTGQLWDQSTLESFTNLAEEMHMTIEVHVTLTIKENDSVRDVGINMSFPQPHADSSLAKAVLERSLEVFERNSPAAELFGIRARIKSNNTELLRYDLGPSVAR